MTDCEPVPCAQSADPQIRVRPEVTTTVANLLPMLKRHGLLAVETASTPNRGHLPAWYQYRGETSESTTSPRPQAGTRGSVARATVRRSGARAPRRCGGVLDTAEPFCCGAPAMVSTSETPDSAPEVGCPAVALIVLARPVADTGSDCGAFP